LTEFDTEDNSNSNLSDFDVDIFGYEEITAQVEEMVKTSWGICDPLDEIYGITTFDLIKQIVKKGSAG